MASLACFARCGRSAVGAGGGADTRPARPSVEIQARAGGTLRKLTAIALLPADTTIRRDLGCILPQRLTRFNRGLSALSAALPSLPAALCVETKTRARDRRRSSTRRRRRAAIPQTTSTRGRRRAPD